MSDERISLSEQAALSAAADGRDRVGWLVRTELEKREGNWTDLEIAAGIAPAPYERMTAPGNLLTNAGAQALWQGLTGALSTPFNSTNAHVGVGNGTAAAAASQNALAGSSTARQPVGSGYPQVNGNQISFRATFGGAEANFAWEEWAVFNAATGGTMLNRRVQAFGTKASGTSWTITVTISLS